MIVLLPALLYRVCFFDTNDMVPRKGYMGMLYPRKPEYVNLVVVYIGMKPYFKIISVVYVCSHVIHLKIIRKGVRFVENCTVFM